MCRGHVGVGVVGRGVKTGARASPGLIGSGGGVGPYQLLVVGVGAADRTTSVCLLC